MKKGLIICFVLCLFFVPTICAVEFDMKDEFNKGETLLCKISGNFIEPILKENIFFYRGHVRIPAESYVVKIENDFYIYASLLGKDPDNYSLAIENIKYLKEGEISEENLIKNFSINEVLADFLIDPGFIVTKEDFFIEVQNLQDYEITIQINTNASFQDGQGEGFFSSLFREGDAQGEDSITLKSGERKKIYFTANFTQPTFKVIDLSTPNLKYNLPIYIFIEKEEPIKIQSQFVFEPLTLNFTMPTNSKITKTIYIYNTGETTLENLSLSLSDSLEPFLSLATTEIKNLEKNSSAKIDLYFSSGDKEELIIGQIIAEDEENVTAFSEVYINLVKDFIPLEEKEGMPSVSKTCQEHGGKICKKEEECQGESIIAKDDKCCLGNCKEIEKSSKGKIIGWFLVIIVLSFLYWLWKVKYSKTKRKINLLETAQGFMKKK